MIEGKRILVPTDFSSCSNHALDYAMAFARNSDYELDLLHVVDTSGLAVCGMEGAAATAAHAFEALEDKAKESLNRMADKVRAQGTAVETFLVNGRPEHEIVAHAKKHENGLIVIGSHGRTGFNRFVFGSTCERVVRKATAPVLTIKDPEHDFVHEGVLDHIRKVVCPCDLTEFSDAGIALAESVCRVTGAPLVLMHVVDSRLDFPKFMPGEAALTNPGAHDAAVNYLRERADEIHGVDVSLEVVTGIPHEEIVKTVQREGVDLVVMATHGRTGVGHALLGSVTDRVVRMAPSPVLTICPGWRPTPAAVKS